MTDEDNLQRSAQQFDVIAVDPPPPLEAAASSLRLFWNTLRPGPRASPAWRRVPTMAARCRPPRRPRRSYARRLLKSFPYVKSFLSRSRRACFSPLLPNGSVRRKIARPNLPSPHARQSPTGPPVEWEKVDAKSMIQTLLSRPFDPHTLLLPNPNLRVTDDHPYTEYFFLHRLSHLFGTPVTQRFRICCQIGLIIFLGVVAFWPTLLFAISIGRPVLILNPTLLRRWDYAALKNDFYPEGRDPEETKLQADADLRQPHGIYGLGLHPLGYHLINSSASRVSAMHSWPLSFRSCSPFHLGRRWPWDLFFAVHPIIMSSNFSCVLGNSGNQRVFSFFPWRPLLPAGQSIMFMPLLGHAFTSRAGAAFQRKRHDRAFLLCSS